MPQISKDRMEQRREVGVPRILVVGSINMDLVLELERLPAAGETRLGRSYSYVPGGKGANQAVAAARLGAEVRFVGRVGADAHGKALRETLSRERIDQELLTVDEAAQTGFAVIPVEAGGQNRIMFFPGANLTVRPQDVEEAFRCPADALIVNLEVAPDIVELACRLAREHGVPVVLDAAPVSRFDLRRVRGLEVLSPNETETQAYSGLPCGTAAEAERAARELAALTESRYVVLKLGARGAYLYEAAAGGGELLPACPVVAVDATAAGDAFTAALTDGYLRTRDIRRAVRGANLVGALAVTRLGAQPSLPRRAEVESFARERGLEL